MKTRLERDQYLAEHEIRALLTTARTRHSARAPRDYALLSLLATTGIRPGEALALTVGDCKLTDHGPQIRVRRLKKRAEAGRIDDLPIARGLARVLRRHVARLGGPGPLAPATGRRLFPMTVRNLELLFKGYLKRAGLSPTFHLYALRHGALTCAYARTKDLRLVQEMAGHASITTTQIYTHIDPREKRRAAELVGAAVGGPG